jgi:hypothetical protein
MLGQLNDDNRASVVGALRLFNAYASQIGVKEDLGRRPKENAAMPRFDLQEARRMAVGY